MVCIIAASLVVKAAVCYFSDVGFDSLPSQLFVFAVYVHRHMILYIRRMYLEYTLREQALIKYIHKKVWKHNMNVYRHGIYKEL
jgi:hypothetical protein